MSSYSACVLAVDDNATIRRAIAMRLSSKGYQVVTAEDGPQALAALERQPFDLMLLDLQMPGMRGDEVLQTVRKQYSDTQLPVIMLTGSEEKQDINRTLELGANDYVVKPGDLPILLARIHTQLALKAAADKLREHEQYPLSMTAPPLGMTAPPLPIREIVPEAPATHRRDWSKLRRHSDTFLYDHLPITCLTLSANLQVLLANRFGLETFGYAGDEVQDHHVLDGYAQQDQAKAQELFTTALAEPDRLHFWEIRRRRKNGELLWVRETARIMGSGQDAIILLTCEDIDEAYKLSERLNYHSSHDELTGLANRKVLEDRLRRVLESAQSEDSRHALAIIDIDQFRIINDTCGHAAGDELLRQIARILLTVIRKRDTLARIGGDDFALLIEDCPLPEATTALEAARAAVEGFEFEWEDRDYRVSLSIGLVALTNACDSVAGALSMADTACYAAKEIGRNRVHVYQPDDFRMVSRHGQMRWATRINDALLENRFELCLQSIVPIQQDAPGDHYEILIRMRDERGQLVMPNEFLPAAERYNLAGRIDRWVVSNAFEWLRTNPRLLDRLHVCAINLSGQSFGSEELLAFILQRMGTYRIPPGKLCFEVTETAAVADIVQAGRFMQTLKARGCLFALDDFGSGFSSFGYLKNLPVDILKIDGSFVRGIANDMVDLAMVKSVNEIGHLMGMRTVAEFVEDEHVLGLLREAGVDYAQGYAIGRPILLSEFAQKTLR